VQVFEEGVVVQTWGAQPAGVQISGVQVVTSFVLKQSYRTVLYLPQQPIFLLQQLSHQYGTSGIVVHFDGVHVLGTQTWNSGG
jgi:hypothetical protein